MFITLSFMLMILYSKQYNQPTIDQKSCFIYNRRYSGSMIACTWCIDDCIMSYLKYYSYQITITIRQHTGNPGGPGIPRNCIACPLGVYKNPNERNWRRGKRLWWLFSCNSCTSKAHSYSYYIMHKCFYNMHY